MRRSDRIGAIPQGYAACGAEALVFEPDSEEKLAKMGALPVQELLVTEELDNNVEQ